MKLEITNKNYCASIVELTKIIPHPNADKLEIALIFGNSVIVSKGTPLGTKGIFFPLESKLNEVYLYDNNLFRDKTENTDKAKAGFFEKNGRVRAVRLRSVPSEGFFMPMDSLNGWLSAKEIDSLKVGDEFNVIDCEFGKVTVCEKYIIPVRTSGLSNKSKQQKAVPRESRLVDKQFSLHIDTPSLKKEMFRVSPLDMISITSKFHGTSFVVANVLTKKKQNFFQKLFRLDAGTEYGFLHSSRKVIKDKFFEDGKNNSNHFYGYDLWDEIANELKEVIPKGISLYGEAVGYTKDGGAIQKDYPYDAKPNKFSLYIYRITSTNVDGDVIEFTWGQIEDFCNKYFLKFPHRYYYGLAKDLYPEVALGDHWHENFLERLMKDENFDMNDAMCRFNDKKVPSEGIVLKVDNLYQDEVWKLKNWLFLSRETENLDRGEINMEDNQTAE
jgi:hypothetical protein